MGLGVELRYTAQHTSAPLPPGLGSMWKYDRLIDSQVTSTAPPTTNCNTNQEPTKICFHAPYLVQASLMSRLSSDWRHPAGYQMRQDKRHNPEGGIRHVPVQVSAQTSDLFVCQRNSKNEQRHRNHNCCRDRDIYESPIQASEQTGQVESQCTSDG